jgi:RNA polymerase sigma-70 factor (ECF subfamily)
MATALMIEKEFDGSDAESVDRFLQGDPHAFEELVRRHQRRVYNLALRFLRSPDEAQEMTQEIFVKLYRSLKGFRGEAKFSTWLYLVAVNHCKNRLKFLNRRHYFTSDPLDPPDDPDERGPRQQFAAADPDPEQQMMSADTQRAVRRAIDELSDDHRLAIVLRDLQGLSYEEVAEATGETVGTVKSRIHRARLELARKLRPFVETEGMP